MGDVEFAENAESRESKRRSGEMDPQPAATSTNSRKERPKSGAFRSNAVKRQSYHQQHINRRNRQVAAGRSQFGGMLSSDMAIVQLANLKKQWVTEMKQINTQKKRMKDIERNVTELKKQEKGLGVKKANARIAKLEDHLDKMTGLVMDETRERENAEKDVRTLTEEVTKYSKLYEDKCHRVENLVNEKISLERQVLEKKRTFDTMIKEQEARLNAVEEELYGLDEALKRDNMVRNRINDDKKTIESVLDKLRDLQKSEENNITADKDFILDMVDAIEITKDGKRTSVKIGSVNMGDSRGSSLGSSTSSTYLPAFYNTSSTRSTNQMSATRFSIMQGRESYKAKRETITMDGPPTFLQH